MSNDIETSLSDLPLWSDEEAHEILIEICEKYQIPTICPVDEAGKFTSKIYDL